MVLLNLDLGGEEPSCVDVDVDDDVDDDGDGDDDGCVAIYSGR